MKNLMIILMVMSVGCATSRTRSSDPVMRIAIDADSMPIESYVRLQAALVKSKEFIVIDRAAGFQFMDKEQRMQHESNRFEKAERYAEWGKMYGVGGVVVGIQACSAVYGWTGPHLKCQENLSLIDVTTGETLAVSEDTQNTDMQIANPSWEDAVNEMIDHFPKTFVNDDNLHQTVEYQSVLKSYRAQLK